MPYSPKKKVVLEKDEVEDMIVKAYELFTEEEGKDLRIASLVAFLWLAGCRISEALAVKREDVKMDEDYVYVTITPLKQLTKTKEGTKKRLIPVSLVFPRRKTIFTRLIIRQALATEMGHSLWDMVRETAWRHIVALNPKVYPHIFRHSRATHLADKGIGDDQMKRWMGWSPKSNMPSTYIRYSKLQMSKIGEMLEED